MDLKVLKDIGLTDGEIRAYTSLLEIGKSTAGKIIEKSKISPSKIYGVLNRLIEKGLASYIMEGKIKHFKASPPDNVLNYIKRKQNQLQDDAKEFVKVLPLLKSKQKEGVKKFNAEIFEGTRGLLTVFDMSYQQAKRGDTLYAFGYPKYPSLLFSEYWKEFHRKCDKKGICRKVIYEYDTWHAKKREKRKLSKHRIMPKNVKTPTWVYIFNDKVAIIIITPEQKVCFLIQNKDVADSYITYFNLLWNSVNSVKE
jgi:HTH-type transcriptional regulator, sugar sensing transcriptional regulator